MKLNGKSRMNDISYSVDYLSSEEGALVAARCVFMCDRLTAPAGFWKEGGSVKSQELFTGPHGPNIVRNRNVTQAFCLDFLIST